MRAVGEEQGTVVEGYNGLGFRLLACLHGETGAGNVLLSPLSVGLALTLAANGAAGETYRELAAALGAAGLSRDGLNEGAEALCRALKRGGAGGRLAAANSLWVRAGLTLDAAYRRRMEERFGARVTALDFADPTSVETINRWVREQTRGLIAGIIDEIAATDVLFLLNAVAFRGRWQRPFDPARTAAGWFQAGDGAARRVAMMEQSGSFLYHETADLQAVSLPYEGGRLRMELVLPGAGLGPADLLAEATAETWAAWPAAAGERDGRVVLPRFQVTYDVTLNEALRREGIRRAFADAAFPGLFAQPGAPDVAIDRVQHRTFLEVHEEGTEAAAVTSVSFRATAAWPDPAFEMVLDRPFLLAIRETESGAVLFLGAVLDPAAPGGGRRG